MLLLFGRFCCAAAAAQPGDPLQSPDCRRALDALQAQETATAAEAQLGGYTSWTFGPLPELLEIKVAGREIGSAARQFLAFLASAPARAILERHGL